MRISLVLFLLFIATNLLSQNGKIEGVISDSVTNEIIPFGSVFIREIKKGVQADENGYFILKNIPPAKYRIEFSTVGFEKKTIEIVVTANETTTIKAMLAEGPTLEEMLPYEQHIPKISDSISDQKIIWPPFPFADSVIVAEVIVEGTRASENYPIAYTELARKDIDKLNTAQDMAYILRYTPSLVATSDAGNGVGYTGLWIRGSDPSRINVTVNGIPLNDPESQQVFWVNTPDFGSSVNNIQIQRGVGTSANGASSFGGAIKLETRDVRSDAYAQIKNGYGSFNTWKNNISLGTGLLKDHFVFEGRISRIASDGYVDRASSDLKSFFFEGNYLSEKTTLKFTAFGGKERTYQSWNGTPWEVLYGTEQQKMDFASRNYFTEEQTQNLRHSGRTYNFYQYKNQVDNYGQDHFQLHLMHRLGEHIRINASAHYTHGEGYYEELKNGASYSSYGLSNVIINQDTITSTDLIRRRWLRNDFYGGVFSFVYQNKKLESVLGGAWNEYDGHHFGELTWMQYAGDSFIGDHYYDGKSQKQDGNIYWKNNYTIEKKIDIYTDLQVRSVRYETAGVDNDLRSYSIKENLVFFNPKIGVNYRTTHGERFYASAAVGNKEPNRNDYTDRNQIKSLKPEQMLDIEIGFQLKRPKWNASLNFYDMIYKNQLVLTGELNDVGAPLRTNVPSSFRRGFEIEAVWNVYNALSVSGNVTLSQNQIKEFVEVLYDYSDDSGDIVHVEYQKTNISFSPAIISAGQLNCKLFAQNNSLKTYNLEIALMSKYVGEQYLDNTQNKERSIEAYFVNDFRISGEKHFKNNFKVVIMLTVNNWMDVKYSSNGYTYSYLYGSRVNERFYYPQAGRNWMTNISLHF